MPISLHVRYQALKFHLRAFESTYNKFSWKTLKGYKSETILMSNFLMFSYRNTESRIIPYEEAMCSSFIPYTYLLTRANDEKTTALISNYSPLTLCHVFTSIANL